MKNIKQKLDYFVFSRFYDQFINTILKESEDCETLLDIGCGYNPSIKRLTGQMKYSVGVDAFQPSIDRSVEDKTHHDFYIGNIPSCLTRFEEKSFDLVISLDLIEHLTKPQGYELINHMDRISKKKVILFTTNGFVSQKPFDGNPWQEHISGWNIEELKAHGFTTIHGFGGVKHIRGERFSIKFKPRVFWKFIAFYSQIITFKNPKIAYSLLCIKNHKPDVNLSIS